MLNASILHFEYSTTINIKQFLEMQEDCLNQEKRKRMIKLWLLEEEESTGLESMIVKLKMIFDMTVMTV